MHRDPEAHVVAPTAADNRHSVDLSSPPIAACPPPGVAEVQRSGKAKEHVLGGTTLEDLGRYIVQHDVRRILVLIGAGASVAAGIPDFRSPNTGLYAKLGKYGLRDPSDAFSISLLRESPSVFYTIANEMNLWPGSYRPTAVHFFVKLLSDEGRLLRCCTQNIDGLERAAGVPDEQLVEAHGSFSSASCIDCHRPFDIQRNRAEAQRGSISHCDVCCGIVKPDVVFFGEQLPDRFFHVLGEDTQAAELVIIVGTSLQVRPFALLPLRVGPTIPRVLINMERVGGPMFCFPSDDDGDEEEDDDDDSERLTRQDATSDENSSSSSGSSFERDVSAAGGDALEGTSDEGKTAEADASRGLCQSSAVVEDREEEEGLANGCAASDQDRGRDESPSDATSSSSSSSDGFLAYEEFQSQYWQTSQLRDVFFKGDCQRTIRLLADSMGLGDKLAATLRGDPLEGTS